jgi:hypothetical protein
MVCCRKLDSELKYPHSSISKWYNEKKCQSGDSYQAIQGKKLLDNTMKHFMIDVMCQKSHLEGFCIRRDVRNCLEFSF